MTQTTEFKLTPATPHLLQAYWSWIEENGLTPHILFLMPQNDSVAFPSVTFPVAPRVGKFGILVHSEGRMFQGTGEGPHQICNISDRACRHLEFGDAGISGRIRISGKSSEFFIPYNNLVSIYSREIEDEESGRPYIHHHFPYDNDVDRSKDQPMKPQPKQAPAPSAPAKRERPSWLRVVGEESNDG